MYDFDFGPMLLLGAAMCIQIALVSPPGIIWFLWWLFAPHIGIAEPTFRIFAIMLGIWAVPVVGYVAWLWWPHRWRA